jgi:hypothetical protein
MIDDGVPHFTGAAEPWDEDHGPAFAVHFDRERGRLEPLAIDEWAIIVVGRGRPRM